MKSTDMAHRAHLKLMEELGDRIRTHYQPVVNTRGRKYLAFKRAELKVKLEACFARGLTRKQACRACGTTNKTIKRMFGPA